MSSFEWYRNIEDSNKDGLIITTTTGGPLFMLKAANMKPPNVSLDVMDIKKHTGGICRGVLSKDYAVYKK